MKLCFGGVGVEVFGDGKLGVAEGGEGNRGVEVEVVLVFGLVVVGGFLHRSWVVVARVGEGIEFETKVREILDWIDRVVER